MTAAGFTRRGGQCLSVCHSLVSRIRKAMGHSGLLPTFFFLNEVEKEGGIFFWRKGKGVRWSYLYLWTKPKEKQRKNTELDYS